MAKHDILIRAKHLNKAIHDLHYCIVEGQIRSVFSKYKIKTPEDKTELLRRCMNATELSSPHEELSAQDEYDYTLSVFLEGSWRLLADG